MYPTLTLQKIHVRELTPFEMGLRNFCFESDRRFFIEVGDRQIQLFFDPDICMILEDGLPEQIDKLSQGKEIYIAVFYLVRYTLAVDSRRSLPPRRPPSRE